MNENNFEPQVVAQSADGSATLAFLPNQPDDNAVFLSEMNRGYDGNQLRMEVSAHHALMRGPEPERKVLFPHYEKPGVTLQRVEGCGYDVTTLTPDEAERLGNLLIAAAKETRADFERDGAEADRLRREEKE